MLTMTVEEKERIFNEGFMASQSSKLVYDCPYEEGTDFADMWIDGFDFQRETAGTIFSTYTFPPNR